MGLEPTTPGLKVAPVVSEITDSVNNSEAIKSFMQDRQARGLSTNTIRFYSEKRIVLVDGPQKIALPDRRSAFGAGPPET